MLIGNKKTNKASFFTEVLKWLPKPLFGSISVKFPVKYFLVTVLSTIIIWSVIASAVIYRNSYKPDIGKLADILEFNGRREKHKTGQAIKAFLLAPYNWITANLVPEEIPHIYIDIKFKNYQKILKKREQALSKGTLRPSSNDYIPATINYGGDSFKVKLRLKGELSDHWKGDKRSFRVNLKGDNRLFGMSRFSLQNPPTRSFESEIIFFESLRREGILTPRYFFVDLTINGKYTGIMAFQEHFSKELLESQGRKESVIIKFDEDNIYTLDEGGPLITTAAFNSFRTNLIEPYRFNKIKKSRHLSKDLEVATGLLRGFTNGTLSTSQVFDVDLMGAFMAVAAAWGAEHPIRFRNMKFYYNPITGLIEPIGYDISLSYFKRRYFDITSNYDMIGSDIMESDSVIKAAYESTLKKLKREAESGITEGWVTTLQKHHLKILHKEYPLLGGINLFGMAKGIQENLDRSEQLYSKHSQILLAHLIEDKTGNYIELVNPLPHHLIIKNVELETTDNLKKLTFKTALNLKYPFELLRTPLQNIPTSIRLYSPKKIKTQNDSVVVTAHIKGHNKIWKILARPYFPERSNEVFPITTLSQALEKHPYLIKTAKPNSLMIKEGTWIIEDPLIIPKGFSLTILKNTTLQFRSNSALILKGALKIEGTRDNPVLLTGIIDSSHQNNSWLGISVQNTNSTSTWSHVMIKNVTGVNINDWNLSGGVNFYEAPIQMKDVFINGSKAEDALNIVRSTFNFDSIIIKNTASDAFDSDFSTGTVTNGAFENIGHLNGGDGIDISGSNVVIKNTTFKNVSDKALSVGEKSEMNASDVSIYNVGIAAVSKDGSLLTLDTIKIKSAKKAGLMAYIKKPEYGPATIEARNVEMESVFPLAVAQKRSHIRINGSEIKETDLNIKNLYATQKK